MGVSYLANGLIFNCSKHSVLREEMQWIKLSGKPKLNELPLDQTKGAVVVKWGTAFIRRIFD
jgi:hypothetical protein